MNSEQNPPLMVYTTSWCPDCHRSKFFLDEYGINYTEIDVEKSEEGMAYVKKVNGGVRVVPTILFEDGTILVEPSNRVLAEKLGVEM